MATFSLRILLAVTSVAGAAGAAPLIAPPGAPDHDAAVATKIDGLERQVHGLLTVPLGWGLEAFVDDPANRSLIDAFIASGERDFQAQSGKHPYEVLREYGEFGDLGMFGGVQAAGDAFRYAVLRDSGAPQADVDRARDDLVRAMRGLHWYHQVTGVPGVVARGLRRITPESGEPALPGVPPEVVPLKDGSGNPLPADKENSWRGDNSGALPFLIWEDNTSKDQLDGWVFALGAAYDVAKDDPSIPKDVVDALVADALAVGTKLMEKVDINGKSADLVIMDADGRPTRFHDLSAEELTPGFVLDRPANGFNAWMSLSVMRTFFHMTGDAAIGRFYYDDLLGTRDYLASAEESMRAIYMGNETNYSNVNMAFVAAYGLVRYEKDPALAARVRKILEEQLYRPGKDREALGLKQSLFDFLYAGFRSAGTSGEGAQAVADGLETLREHPSAPYWDDLVENCDAAEVAALSCTAADGTSFALSPDPGRGGGLVAVEPVPMRLRPPSNFEWRSDPHRVNGGGSDRLNPGGEIVAAYWLGRFLEGSDDGTANISPHARDNVTGSAGSDGGGSGGSGGGAAGGSGGSAGAPAAPSEESDGGCGCRAAGDEKRGLPAALVLALALAVGRRRAGIFSRNRRRRGDP
jgi:hypothetical protein